MRITNLRWFVLLGAMALALSACGSTATPAPTPRVATQTPWVIYVPVSVTPEPATVTPLPTATEAKQPATRTPTRRPAAPATKPAPTTAPVAAVPSATSAPACNLGTVVPFFPENGVTRIINLGGSGGPAFEFKWTTPIGSSSTDPSVGYRIDIASRRLNGQLVNGDIVYVSHNKFIEKNSYIYEGTRVRRLGQEDDVVVTWQVTIVKTGGYDELGGKTGTELKCGAPSTPFTIKLTYQ